MTKKELEIENQKLKATLKRMEAKEKARIEYAKTLCSCDGSQHVAGIGCS